VLGAGEGDQPGRSGPQQTKDAEVFTRASFTIEDRKPGLHQTSDTPPAAARTSAAPQHDTIAWETHRP
jgi:alkaline phosphatase D